MQHSGHGSSNRGSVIACAADATPDLRKGAEVLSLASVILSNALLQMLQNEFRKKSAGVRSCIHSKDGRWRGGGTPTRCNIVQHYGHRQRRRKSAGVRC